MNTEQTYANHVRWYPLAHFVIAPLLALIAAYQIVRLYQEPDLDRAFIVILIFVMTLINFAARLQSLKAQDRVIRLEERLRYREVLEPSLAAAACELPAGKMISLRFASDAELPALIQRVVSGELRTSKEIKTAIKEWRGDYLRV